jgi:hypothetical protein
MLSTTILPRQDVSGVVEGEVAARIVGWRCPTFRHGQLKEPKITMMDGTVEVDSEFFEQLAICYAFADNNGGIVRCSRCNITAVRNIQSVTCARCNEIFCLSCPEDHVDNCAGLP